MATDYTTSPVTKAGQLIFGVGCGLLTVFIRYFGSYPEGRVLLHHDHEPAGGADRQEREALPVRRREIR